MTAEIKKVAIIGGGAAGLMAAAAVMEQAVLSGTEVEVMLFEKNERLGRKVAISGGGRCNVTTGIIDVRKVLENYPRGAKFIMSAMFRFPPQSVMEWFTRRGVKLVTEDDLRVFPFSGKGLEVVDAVEAYLRGLGVKILYHSPVGSVKKEGEMFLIEVKPREGDVRGSAVFEADALIITTGGSAYAQTGSAGEGYEFAKSFGHKITKMVPSLGGLTVSDEFIAEMAGVSMINAELKLTGAGVYKRTGPFVFTHRGVSGPAVFALQSMAAYEAFSRANPLDLQIDFFPYETKEELKKRLQKAIEQNGKKSAKNLLDMFLPKSACGPLLKNCGVDENVVSGSLSKVDREKIVGVLKNFILHVSGVCGGDEFVTAGGVDVDEIDTATMESKICPGLYFAGEILDVDGFTGGFNLQSAWATGRLAGESAVEKFVA